MAVWRLPLSHRIIEFHRRYQKIWATTTYTWYPPPSTSSPTCSAAAGEVPPRPKSPTLSTLTLHPMASLSDGLNSACTEKLCPRRLPISKLSARVKRGMAMLVVYSIGSFRGLCVRAVCYALIPCSSSCCCLRPIFTVIHHSQVILQTSMALEERVFMAVHSTMRISISDMVRIAKRVDDG